MAYFILSAVFALAFMFANILGGTILPFPWTDSLFITSGTLLCPITFFISDTVTEIFGEKKARRMVAWGFLASLSAFLYTYFTGANVRVSGLLILSSLIAFVVGQLLDIRLYTLIGRLTKQRHLWLRSQASTYISQLIDTLIVNFFLLFLGFGLSIKDSLPILMGNIIYKTCFTTISLPLFYRVVHILRRRSYEIT